MICEIENFIMKIEKRHTEIEKEKQKFREKMKIDFIF